MTVGNWDLAFTMDGRQTLQLLDMIKQD